MSTKEFFPNLNAYRFLAAGLVVLHHVEQIRANAKVYHLKDYSLFNNGSPAVQFFFVLSGFLITYLLLKEHQKTSTVSLSVFYLKRVLRIWPLYYAIVLLGFVILPLISSAFHVFTNKFPYLNLQGFLLYVFILPNVANAFWSKHFLITLWSIGVEEQFYLVWAPVVKWFRKYLLAICMGIIAARLVYEYFIVPSFSISPLLITVLQLLKFDCMAVGALLALWFHVGISGCWKSWIYTPLFELLVIFLIFLQLAFRYFLIELHPFFNYVFESPFSTLFFSTLYGFLVLNAGTNPKTLFAIKSKWMDYLGTISYGMYMYHMIVIFALMEVLKKIPFMAQSSIWGTLCIYTSTFAVTIAVSAASYKILELPIIRLKEKFIK